MKCIENEILQQQEPEDGLPVNFEIQELIISVAQPQPSSSFTVIALTGQLVAQAPHSMQAPLSISLALPFSIEKILCGQVVSHMPQPIQRSVSRLSIGSFSR